MVTYEAQPFQYPLESHAEIEGEDSVYDWIESYEREISVHKVSKAPEFKYPSQDVTDSTAVGILHPQIGRYREIMKKGLQQATNVPVMMASVLQAFLSRLLSMLSLIRFLRLAGNLIDDRFEAGLSSTKLM